MRIGGRKLITTYLLKNAQYKYDTRTQLESRAFPVFTSFKTDDNRGRFTSHPDLRKFK